MTLSVTDDEAMAAVGMRRKLWPGVLPTIDTTDPDLVAAATFRGGRSLNVRGMLRTEDATLTDEAAPLLRILDGEPVASGFVAPTDTPLAATGSGFVVIRDDDGYVVDLTLADGTHDLTVFPDSTGPIRVVANLARSVHIAGVAGDRALTLLIGSSDSGAPGVFTVSRGVAAPGRLEQTEQTVTVVTNGPVLDEDGLVAEIHEAWRARVSNR